MSLANAIKTKIYVLCDETDYPRYIGKTAGALQYRLKAHIDAAKK